MKHGGNLGLFWSLKYVIAIHSSSFADVLYAATEIYFSATNKMLLYRWDTCLDLRYCNYSNDL